MGSAADQTKTVDYLIVGAGPAGLQMGYYMTKYGSNHLILDANDNCGGSFMEYPRHRTLISINKKYNCLPEPDFNMRHDWNSLLSDDNEVLFTNYTDVIFPNADILVDYLRDYTKHYNINIQYNTTVTKIGKKDDLFHVRDQKGGEYICKRVLLATGALRPLLPQIPGIELAETYSNHSLDKKFYHNKRIAIIGVKNSAFESADHLADAAGIIHMYTHGDVKMAWDTHFVGDLRAVNNNIIDMFHLKSLHAVATNSHISSISKTTLPGGKEGLKMNFEIDLPHWSPPASGKFEASYEHIIFCTGWKYIDESIFEADCLPQAHGLQNKFPVLNEMWESTVPGIYYMGTNMQSRDRQSASGFIHGFRYNVRTLFHMLRNKYEGIELPKEVFKGICFKELPKFVIDRISTTSALYQLNQGFFCDVMVFKDGKNGDANSWNVEYFYELPGDYVLKSERFTKEKHVWLITMGDSRKKFFKRLSPTEFSKPPDFKFTNNLCQPYNEAVISWFEYGQLKEVVQMGATLTVRYDFANLQGQKAERPFNKLKNLMCREFELGEDNFDESFFSEEFIAERITPWTQKRIEQEDAKYADEHVYQCDINLNRKFKPTAKA